MQKNKQSQRRPTTTPQEAANEHTADRPALRFSPTAWAKLLFLRDYGETEVGGFGITPAEDLLYVADVQLVDQRCSWAHVSFDDAAVADFFDQQVDAGRQPEQFARIWLHTHPGDCPEPSSLDEETFERAFGRADWAVMAILARGGQTYARLRFGVGPRAELELPVCIDYRRPFDGCDIEVWEAEYLEHVQPEELKESSGRWPAPAAEDELVADWYELWPDETQPTFHRSAFHEHDEPSF